ncbi:MAG: peptidase [Terriglobia bacterium]|nr:MAG: peptidase [Terriglobia bacterium]
MIEGFRHSGLKAMYEGQPRKIAGSLRKRIAQVLAILDAADDIQDANLPGFRLHPLKGNLAGMWSITISGNWRIIFRFEYGKAKDLDLVDYH